MVGLFWPFLVHLIIITQMLFSLSYWLLIHKWFILDFFFVRVFVLLLDFTDGFSFLSLVSLFNDYMYFPFDYYIHLITTDWFTRFVV